MRRAIAIGLPSTTAQVDDPQQCKQDQRQDRREQQRPKAAQLIGKQKEHHPFRSRSETGPKAGRPISSIAP